MWPLRHFALWFSLSTLASFLHSQPSWPWPCKIVLSTWDVQIRAQTRETHLEQGSPTGLGHFHHPQSLSGKFRPSSRQAAGCAQGDLQGMKLFTHPRRKILPWCPRPAPNFDFCMVTVQPSEAKLRAPLHQGFVTAHRIPGTSCGFRALATEPLPNAKAATKENNPFWQQGRENKNKLSLTGWFLKQIFPKEKENPAGFQIHKLKWLTDFSPVTISNPSYSLLWASLS